MMFGADYFQSWVEMDEADDRQRLRELDRTDYAQIWRELEADEDEGGGPRPLFDAWEGALWQACDAFARKEDRDPELSRLPYYQYLQTSHWLATRRRALQRAGYQCKRCEARGQRLDVHHLTYARLGRELESDLTVLCELCHAREHREGKPR